ncbi:MAG TPA: S8 family serine peptidase [Stellaceae bacterium]|nr:S8 family serine peptidase [Stellaceae bacterium]
MLIRLIAAALVLAVAAPAVAAEKQHISREADLPRFSYAVTGKLEEMVRNPALFAPFAASVRRDVEAVLNDYEIDDKATHRQLLGELATLDLIEGRYDDALSLSNEIRALQEKPADKLLSGQQIRAIVAAVKGGAPVNSPAYFAAVGKGVAAELSAMPYTVIENDIKGAKERNELIGETLILGQVRDVMQPTVDKTGTLSSDLAPSLISARWALTLALPLKQTLIETYGAYIAAHKVEKPDIWTARAATLPPDAPAKPVTIGIWDSGIDTKLFPGRVVMESGMPALIAFDRYARPSTGELAPIPEQMKGHLTAMTARLKGFSDLESDIDSPEAGEVKHFLSTLPQDQYKGAIEELNLAGDYVHGTHVAGIAVAGNPFARLLVGRIEFGYTLLPDPCPSQELVERDAHDMQSFVDFMKSHGARVVNMSWGGSVLDVEHDLEVCGVGKSPDDRRMIARDYFETTKRGLAGAIASAPGILFVAAAGNSNRDASFTETIPAAIDLPNLLVVGAVDGAGDEAPFTSYGPTVKVHADGYQVDSVVPGGTHLALSGTSMAAPEVTNLAAKLIALKPSLKPTEVTELILKTSDRTEDGRRTLINPAKAIAALR